MNSIGIVCEYNPFHRGHLYQIAQSKSSFDDAALICVMSGDFVQRGEAAMFSKFVRAEAACMCGADVVVELPLPYCISSAERFASAGVRLLDAMGCTHISFGSECGDLRSLTKIADYLNESDTVSRIKESLHRDANTSFAQARERLVCSHLGPELSILLREPNNILAVEYLKAIKSINSSMEPFTLMRIGSAHDSASDVGPLSSSHIRQKLSDGDSILPYVPEPAYRIYEREKKAGRIKNSSIMELSILSRLRMLPKDCFEALPDGADGAGLRLYNKVHSESSVDAIAVAAQTRRYPLARIRRMMLCAALGVDASHTISQPSYARILAANEKGRRYLRQISDLCTLPIISRSGQIKKLDAYSYEVFAKGASAHDLYTLQFVTNCDKLPSQDWKRSMFVV